ncbi:MAG: AbrB/MazE/SpoVT family DNA-binding domain-containing protein [Planctomycetota bacterium]
MLARIQKWGNSLGLRIPKALAADARVAEGTSVELNVENGRLIVVPRRKVKCSIEDLVARITPENLHGETDTGTPVGREVW